MPQIDIRRNIRSKRAHSTYNKLADDNESQLIETMKKLVLNSDGALGVRGSEGDSLKRFTKPFDSYKSRKPKTFKL